MSDLPLVQELAPVPDPAACCERLANWPHRLWLDSTADADRLGRYSFLTADPFTILEASGSQVTRIRNPGGAREAIAGDALGCLRDLLAPFRCAPLPDIPPFQGGAAGYIGYEFGGTLEQLPVPPADGLGVPDLVFGLFDWTLAWDHLQERAWLISTGVPECGAARRRRAEARMAEVLERLRGVQPWQDVAAAH